MFYCTYIIIVLLYLANAWTIQKNNDRALPTHESYVSLPENAFYC